MGNLRVAAFQRRPLYHDASQIIERLSVDLAWCDHAKVDLALFPECYLQGYTLDRTTLDDLALDLESRELSTLLTCVAANRTTFVLGLIEGRGESVFNTAAVVRRGAVLGAYRKMHLHHKEQAFTAGRECPIFESAGWRFGINICYDANFPDVAARVVRQGARLICYPLNNMLPPDVADRWRGRSIDNLRRRAVETGCWIVSSDVVGSHDSMLCHGCTCVADPAGSVVARVEEGAEGVVLFDCR